MEYWRQPLDKDRVSVPVGTVHLIAERCKGCGFCIEFCPRRILTLSDKTNSKGYRLPFISRDLHCPDCGLCMLLCPDFAIYVEGAAPKGAAD